MTKYKRIFRIPILLFCLGPVVGWTDSIESEIAKHLPPGASAAHVPGIGRSEVAAAAIGSIARPGSKDLAFVYQLAGRLALRVVIGDSRGFGKTDTSLPGTYVNRTKPLPVGILLSDFSGRGTCQVLVVTSEGASVGSYLNVFALERNTLINVVHAGVIGGYDFDLDCEVKQPCRIISYGKWTDRESSWVEVYEWVGTEFVKTGNDVDRYFSRRLHDLAESAATEQPTTVARRTGLAKQAAALYLDWHQYDDAIGLSKRILAQLDDPTKSIPRSPGKQPLVSPEVELNLDLREGRAAMHELLAHIYEAAGLAAQAQSEYREARLIRKGSDQ